MTCLVTRGQAQSRQGSRGKETRPPKPVLRKRRNEVLQVEWRGRGNKIGCTAELTSEQAAKITGQNQEAYAAARRLRDVLKLFGQIRTLKVRNSARFVQTGRIAFPLLTRSQPHICAENAQRQEISKVGSNPVRVASLVKSRRSDFA